MAELGASRQANEWQAAQLREQSETIGRLRSDLESNASEVIGLKIREHQLMSDVARQMAEVQSLRAELALARSNVHTSTPPQIETGWQSEQDAAVEPMLGISGRWCVVTTAVAVIAALGAWALSAGFRW
jgi:predicted RNase H-like nuclease (RuvC/YqgF family)